MGNYFIQLLLSIIGFVITGWISFIVLENYPTLGVITFSLGIFCILFLLHNNLRLKFRIILSLIGSSIFFFHAKLFETTNKDYKLIGIIIYAAVFLYFLKKSKEVD